MIKLSNKTRREENPVNFPNNLGESESASLIRKEAEELIDKFASSNTFGERLSRMLEELLIVEQKYSVDNWDGCGAESISMQSYQNARRLALSLPPTIPVPEIYVSPSDGEVVFEWYEGKRQVYSISIGKRNELSYAGLYGIVKTYGIEYFYDSVPLNIIDNIRRVYL